jgi:peptidoglycan hydrolase-like protein with peptidoglycan-binding domain
VKRAALAAAAAIVVIGAGTVAAFGVGGSAGQSPPAQLPLATTTVTRGTLTQTELVTGTLGYGDATTVLGLDGLGVITWLPAPGTRISRGQTVYRDDEKPVPLIYGTVPLYRPLAPGESGNDVAELERNLAALGYTGFTADNAYTSTTASAVRRWQHSLGLPQTGIVDPSAVVVAPDAIRIATLAPLGSTTSGAVLTYTGTVRRVDVALDVAQHDIVHVGTTATITLPDNSTVDGQIASIGTVAVPASNQNAGQPGPITVRVVITVADQSRLGTLEGTPVQVTLVSGQRADVLTVPVQALVALAGGGYGVQVVAGGTTRYVAVTVGLFAGGRVEVSGVGIVAGTAVEVPSE